MNEAEEYSRNTASLLDTALKAAGVPILGVSIGDPADRSTWRVELLETATKEHEATAAALILSVDVSEAASDTVRVTARMRDPFTRSLIAFLAKQFTLTEDAVRDALLAGVKGQASDREAEPLPGVIAAPDR